MPATPMTDEAVLTRYVPRVSAEWELHTDEPWQELDGTLCYIDISGFTALSEKLARRGRIGAEELTDVLNHVFARMLEVAYERGGSLLKFGGDALLLMFRGDDHATQGCSAAVEMQGVLRDAREYRTSAGRLHLKMSVGLHSGLIHLFRVGNSHKELVLTGPAASRTTEMEETAVAGEILISSSTRDALAPGSATKRKGEGWLLTWRQPRAGGVGWVPRLELDAGTIAGAMPMALREFLAHGAAEPEHHIATVGFVKFEGVDELMASGGPLAAAAALDGLFNNVQEVVDDEGVTFLASDIDQDGGKIILVAGVPGVQEDDEGRVLRAARRIADSAGTLTVRIGVNRGHVFVGEIGTEFRATYTIMGDTVNLAARLMAASSKGQVYASPEALDRSLTLFETVPLEPFHVKGKEHPVQAYEVGDEAGSRPSKRGGDLPFTGREDELVALRRLLEDLRHGRGNSVAIVGERGVGKSRLVDELFDELLPDLGHVLHVDMRAEPYGTGTPYRPLRDPIRQLLGIERDSPPAMASALESAMARVLPNRIQLLPLLGDAAMIDVPSTPEVDAIDPRFLQIRTADLLLELFTALHNGPIFFEVEDGQHMDEASVRVMERLAEATRRRPWLVLTTRTAGEGGFDPGKTTIPLGPLTDDESRRLLIAATEGAPLRPHDMETIVARGGGLPLFLEEIIAVVRQTGGVDELPDSLDAVVSAQIDALPPLSRRLVRFASVLGQSFRLEMVSQLLHSEGIVLDDATRRDLTGFLEADGPDRIRFRHGMIRDVAYGGLSFKRRRELHLTVGHAAEQAAGRHTEAVVDVLALHFALGHDHERAWEYCRLAGAQAMDAYANIDAAAHYRRALESVRRLPDVEAFERSAVWTSLGDVNERAGNLDHALEAYRRASALVRADPVARARLAEKRARVRERAGEYPLALREVTVGRRALSTNGSTEAAKVAASLAAFAAATRQAQQRPRLAVEQAIEAVELATLSGEQAALARAYTVLDLCYRWLGEPEKAVYASDALALYIELGDLTGQGVVYGNMGVEAYFDGRWDDSVDYYAKSRDAFRMTGNEIHAASAESNLGELLVNQGRATEAAPILENSLRVFQASDFLDGSSFVEVQLARVRAAEGDLAGACELLEKARSQFIDLREVASVADLAVYLAECHMNAGRAGSALEVLDEADALGGDTAVHSAGVLRVRARALAATGDLAGAHEAIEAGLGDAEAQGLTYDVGLLLLARSEIAERHEGAIDIDALARAEEILSGLGVQRDPETTAVLV